MRKKSEGKKKKKRTNEIAVTHRDGISPRDRQVCIYGSKPDNESTECCGKMQMTDERNGGGSGLMPDRIFW